MYDCRSDCLMKEFYAHCLHCRSWLNTGSFPDSTASCKGVLKKEIDMKIKITSIMFWKKPTEHGFYVTHRPLLFCMLGLAPVLSKASAMRAMPLITSALCFLGLKEQTRCSGVSTAPTVAAFTWAEWRIRKVEANSSPEVTHGQVENNSHVESGSGIRDWTDWCYKVTVLQTSLDGFVQEAPATLIHHVYICLVVDQGCGDALLFSGQGQVQSQISVIVQLIQLPWQLQRKRKRNFAYPECRSDLNNGQQGICLVTS